MTPQERENKKEHCFGKQKGLCLGCGTHYDYTIFYLDRNKPKSKGERDEWQSTAVMRFLQ